MGVAVVFWDELQHTSAEAAVALATLAVVAGAATRALSTVIVKKYLQGLHPVSLSLHQMIWGCLGLLGMGWLLGEAGRIEWTGKALFGLFYLGIFASAIAFSLYYYLLQRLSAVTVSSMIYITPVVAVLSEWWILSRPIGVRTVAGMALVFAGIALAELPRYRRRLPIPTTGPSAHRADAAIPPSAQGLRQSPADLPSPGPPR